MDQELVYFDGAYVSVDEAGYPVWERGVMFADGVYEVLRYEGGVAGGGGGAGGAFEVERHMARLRRSLGGIGLAVSEEQIEEWVAASDGLVERNRWGSALVYWQVTRGFVGEQGRRSHVMVPADEQRAVVMMTGSAVEPVSGKVGTNGRVGVVPGVDVISVADRRWAHCWIKSLMLLPNSAAKTAAVRAGCGEAVLVRPPEEGVVLGQDAAEAASPHSGAGGLVESAAEDGWVTEGASTNVLMVRDGVLWTAPESRWILGGVTRGVLLEEAARLGVPVREQWFTLAELRDADEVMVCGTGTMLARVGRLDGAVVGRDGGAGPRSESVGFEGGVCQRLWEALVGRVCAAAEGPVASDRVKQQGSSGAAV